MTTRLDEMINEEMEIEAAKDHETLVKEAEAAENGKMSPWWEDSYDAHDCIGDRERYPYE